MELEGQVAIVTGAGRGIGRATALELTRLGGCLRINACRTWLPGRAYGLCV